MGILAPKDLSSGHTPAQIYNWRVYALAISASMGSAMFGYDSAFIGGSLSLPSFRTRFGLATASSSETAALSANIVSTFQAGCFFGAIICYLMSETLGRRIILIACGAVFDIGAILQISSSGSLGLIYAGRAFTGLAVGASSLIVPVYISECSPPAIRGRLIGLFEICIQLAQIIGFWVNYGVNLHISPKSDKQWRIPFALQLIPGTMLCLAMFFQPESPRWLVKAGREAEARKVLVTIRRLPESHDYLSWELDMVHQQLERETEGTPPTFISKMKEIASPHTRSRLLIGMALMMLQNLSGINALNYYSPTIFKSIGFTGTSVGLLATGIFGIVKATGTMVFMLLIIDRFGRRPAMLLGSAGAIVSMYYLAGYSKLSHSFQGKAHQDAGAYIAILMIYVFAVFYSFSWNGMPWIFCAEVFPIAVRSTCLVFTTCTQWLGQFIITYSTPYMIENITYGVFLFFGSSVVVGIVFVYFFFPETKGIAIEDMDILFSIKGMARTKRAETVRILEERRAQEGPHGIASVEDKPDVHYEEEEGRVD